MTIAAQRMRRTLQVDLGCRHAVDGGKLCFQQRQPLMQILFAVGGHGQRQFAGLLEAGELLGRYQVVLEVLELA